MSKTMVDLVSRAICCPSGRCENDGKKYDPIKGSVSVCQANSFDREALKAIAAMRKPTEAMLNAAEVERDSEEFTSYQALIDAALRINFPRPRRFCDRTILFFLSLFLFL